MLKTTILTFIFIYSLSNLSMASDNVNCNFKLYWGHTQHEHESPTSILKPIKDDLERGDTTVVGQGCFLKDKGGNLEGMQKSYGPNGDWISKLHIKNNGGFNPINKYDELPPEQIDRIQEIRLINKEIKEISKRMKRLFRRAKDKKKDLRQIIELKALKENHSKALRPFIKKINAVGFYKLTHHNWLTLLLSAMKSATNKESSCSQVNISFHCRYKENKNQKYWDKRIKTATQTDISLDNTGPIAQELRLCAELMTENGSVSIYNVPRNCEEKVSLTKANLIQVYNGCKDLFDEKATELYSETLEKLLN